MDGENRTDTGVESAHAQGLFVKDATLTLQPTSAMTIPGVQYPHCAAEWHERVDGIIRITCGNHASVSLSARFQSHVRVSRNTGERCCR